MTAPCSHCEEIYASLRIASVASRQCDVCQKFQAVIESQNAIIENQVKQIAEFEKMVAMCRPVEPKKPKEFRS